MSQSNASSDPTREIPLLTSCYGVPLRKYPKTVGEGRVWAQATHSGGSVLGKAMPTQAEERRADSPNVFFLVSDAACKLLHSAEATRKYLLATVFIFPLAKGSSPRQQAMSTHTGRKHDPCAEDLTAYTNSRHTMEGKEIANVHPGWAECCGRCLAYLFLAFF